MGSRGNGDGQESSSRGSRRNSARRRKNCVDARGSGLAEVQGEREEYGEERASTAGFGDDILAQVFALFSTRQLLSKLALVCRRWRRLSNGMVTELLPPGVGSPSKRDPFWATPQRVLELLKRYEATLERIELCGLQWPKVDDVASIISSLPKLKDLTISPWWLVACIDVVNIAKALPQQLISLDLHREPCMPGLHPPVVNDQFLLELQQRCILLQKLNLDGHKIITWQGLDGVVGACPMLTYLDVESEVLGWPEVHSILRQCKSLKHLSVVSPPLGDVAVIDSLAGSIVQPGRRSGFRSRERAASTAIEDLNIVEDVSLPPFLSSLRLYTSSYRSVDLYYLQALGLLKKSGHQLRHLHAQGLFNSSWQAISIWCLNLVSLDLSHPKYHSRGLTEIEEVVLRGLVQLLKHLKRLALPSATDRILSELGRWCPKLQELRFQGHYLHSRRSCLHHRSIVTNHGIIQLSEGCPDLRVLSLAGCENMTISSARSLTFHCKVLEELYLFGCANLTDDGVKALLPLMCKSLVALDLSKCSRVTPDIFTIILQASKSQNLSLRMLAVSPHLNIQYLFDFREQFEELLPSFRVVPGYCWEGFYYAR